MAAEASTARDRQLFGWARAGFGALIFFAPRLAGRLAFGHRPEGLTAVALRGLGARDLAIGVGTAMAPGDAARQWLVGGVLADLGDLASIVAGRRHLRKVNLALFAVAATAGAVYGAVQASRP